MSSAREVMAALAEVADPADAVHLQRFFKTGAGEYGEGDVFVGVRVPQTRAVVKRHTDLSLREVDALLDSDVHEHRLAGLLILDSQYERAGKPRTADPARQSKDRRHVSRRTAARAGEQLGPRRLQRSQHPRRLAARPSRPTRAPRRPRRQRIPVGASRRPARDVRVHPCAATRHRPSRSRNACSTTGTTSSRRRSGGCCVRSASGSTSTFCAPSSTRMRRRWAAPRSAMRQSTSTPTSAPPTAAR